MRKIRFRGRDRQGNWVYGYFVGEVGKNCLIYTDEGEFRMVNCDTIGEYTGLKDIKGREIYEGDIVAYRDTKDVLGYVVYYQGAFRIKVTCKDSWCNWLNFIEFCGEDTCMDSEVLGNIHEEE